MTTVAELHPAAMDLAQEAFGFQCQGQKVKSIELYRRALEIEVQAAELVPLSIESEPTRSILYLSAASLAYNAQEYEHADRLLERGLSGHPPDEIEAELRKLREDVMQKMTEGCAGWG